MSTKPTEIHLSGPASKKSRPGLETATWVLCAVTLVPLVFLMIAGGNFRELDYGLVILACATGVGLLMVSVERWFGDLWNSGAARLITGAILAIGAFLARRQAIEEVNAVFGIDSSALPMTLSLATTIIFVHYLWWAFGIAFVVGLVLTIHAFSKKQVNIMLVYLALTISSGLTAAFCAMPLNKNVRPHTYYRFAHDSDFSGRFHCKGVDQSKYSVVFIGPDQRRVLIAQKINESSFLMPSEQVVSYFRFVSIPKTFTIQECEPTVSELLAPAA
jgi:hypothetical protein